MNSIFIQNLDLFSGMCKENTMGNEGRNENLIDKSIGFEEFPNELFLKILSFLGIEDLIKCSQTSKRIRSTGSTIRF